MATPTLVKVNGIAIGTANTTLYTVPTGKVFILKRLTVSNVAAIMATITVSTSAGVANNFVTTNAVATSSSITVPAAEGHVFSAGEVIVASASAAASLTVARMSGILADA